MTSADDEVGARFRALLARRHFLDRESGVLLVWLPADSAEVSRLVAELAGRHPAVHLTVQETGTAVAVRVTGQDHALAQLEALYVEA